MKNIIKNIKAWIIHKLGGLPGNEVLGLCRISRLVAVETHIECLKPWIKTVQEICRRNENSYYDWCCEYCKVTCDKRDGWCERFSPAEVANGEITGCGSSADV